MTKDFLPSFALYIISLALVGVYTVFVYFIGHNFWSENSSASLIYDDGGNIRGSLLLSQKTESDKYFKSRATLQIDTSCDVALYNAELRKFLLESYNKSDKHDIAFITSSSSLLDPYITVREALKQAHKIASSRNVKIEQINQMIQDLSLNKSNPFFELEIVNTTLLNTRLESVVLTTPM